MPHNSTFKCAVIRVWCFFKGGNIVYSPKQIADELGIASSTLRKYADILEKNGYQIKRNNENNRIYDKEDIKILRYFVLVKNQNPKLTNEEILRKFFVINIDKLESQQSIIHVNELLIKCIEAMEVAQEKYKEEIKIINFRLKNMEDFQKELLLKIDQLAIHSNNEEKLDKILEGLIRLKKGKFSLFTRV